MSVGGSLRRCGFWAKDLLSGGQMRKAYLEIRRQIAQQDARTADEIAVKLQKLMEHAVKTTEYYADLTGCDLSAFPVVNKQTIIENREQMRSSVFSGQRLHEMYTSGSTGTPFVIQQDKGKRMRVIAEIKALNMLAPNPYVTHEKMLYIVGAARRAQGRVSRRKELLENIYRIPVSINDEATMEEIVTFLEKKRPTAMHASASNLYPVVEYIKAKKLPPDHFALRTIITGAEMVPARLREDLETVFGPKCKVAVKYSNEEMGIFGMDSGIGTPYILNVSDYYFEILKLDRDQPCEDGELGRIVVTDLYNYALPMIRYDTGDIGAVKKDKDGRLVLVDLHGKRRDLIYNTKGISISGLTITNLMKHLQGVRQWQLVQCGEKKYIYKVVPESGSALTQEMLFLPELRELLGEDADIQMEYLKDDIPSTSSGKRRYTVNLYYPEKHE